MPDHRLAEQSRQLCEQTAKETDPKKLLELTQAINRIFDEREKANQDLARRAQGPAGYLETKWAVPGGCIQGCCENTDELDGRPLTQTVPRSHRSPSPLQLDQETESRRSRRGFGQPSENRLADPLESLDGYIV